jgi:uncharacterized membrane protein YfcA
LGGYVVIQTNLIQWAAGAGEKSIRLSTILALGAISLIVLLATKGSSFGMPSLDDLGAVFLASTLSSIAGFAFSAICGAMLFHLLDNPVKVVQVMMVCSIAMQFFSVITLRNAIDWKHLGRFLAGGVAGLPLGVFLLTHLAAAQYMRCIGVFLVAYGSYMLLRRPVSKVFASSIGDYVAGFVGGLTGGFAAFPGAFVTIWCGWKGWSKDRQRGVYQPYILIMQILALGLITLVQASHSLRATIDLSTLAYVPGAVLGTWCGIAIFRRLTDRQFASAVNVLLIVSGLGLLV